MRVRSQGMVLFTTLMMVTLVALMVLSVMRAVLLLEKINQKLMSTHQAFYELEAAAETIIEKASEIRLSSCVRRADTPETKTCQLTQGSHVYRYWVVDEGVFPCLIIQSEETTSASHHWVISVKREKTAKAVLQLRVATAAEPCSACESPVHALIVKGVMSWRYLADG